jgi:hypothetical protein
MLSTNQKGAIAETAIIHAAIKLGIGVYRPIVDGGRYDLVFDLQRRLVRVQCKWAPQHGDVVVVRCYSRCRTGDGLVTRKYSADEIDAFAAYCPEVDCCYFLPFELFDGWKQIQLRLGPSKNNQNLGINWASDFEFQARLGGTQGP